MSNEKLSIQDLVDAIAQRTGYSKKKSEDFLRVFQSTVEEGLINDGIVKVKGFGTFKLIWNEARKSVNVQTGQEYIIPGHNKVSFIPEASVKEYINEAPETSGAVKPEINPLDKLNEQAEEIKSLISELNNIEPDTNANSGPIEIPEPPVAPFRKEETAAEGARKSGIINGNKPLVAPDEETDRPTPTFRTPTTSTSSNSASTSTVDATSGAEQPPKYEREIPVKKKKKGLIWALIIIGVLIIGGGAIAEWDSIQFFVSHLFDSYETATPDKKIVPKKQAVATVAKPQQPNQQPAVAKPAVQKNKAVENEDATTPEKTASKATKAEPKNNNVEATSKQAKQETKRGNKALAEPKNNSENSKTESKTEKSKTAKGSSKASIFDKPRVYKTFITTETIEKGSHLTLIAQKYYGYKTFWVYIYEANKSKISNPETLPVGFKVKVPKLDPELIDLKNPKCKKYAQELEAKYVQK